jgi:hypothetical protein
LGKGAIAGRNGDALDVNRRRAVVVKGDALAAGVLSGKLRLPGKWGDGMGGADT